jgi:hypothetical protein
MFPLHRDDGIGIIRRAGGAAGSARSTMQIAILTFDGFNELDSFIASAILNRLRPKGWKAFITCPSDVVTSMNGVAVHAERPLEFAAEADAVLIGSGIKTREIARDADLLSRLHLDPARQLIGPSARAHCCWPDWG